MITSFDWKMEDEIPEKCPVCKKGKINFLLHIKKKESCFAEVDKDQYEEWNDCTNKLTIPEEFKSKLKENKETDEEIKARDENELLIEWIDEVIGVEDEWNDGYLGGILRIQKTLDRLNLSLHYTKL